MSPDAILAHCVSLFGPLSSPSPDEYLDACTRNLSGCAPDVLADVITLVDQRFKFWPKPADFYDMVRDAAARVAGRKAMAAASAPAVPRAPKPAASTRPQRSPEEVARVQALVRGCLAEIAAKTPPKPDVPYGWKPVDRDSFAREQAGTPLPGLHRTAAGLARLSRDGY